MGYSWFRMYAEIIDDPKVESLTHTQRWVWIVVLCLASRSPVRGYLLLSQERSGNGTGTEAQHFPVPMRIIAKKADVTTEEAEAALLLFEQLEMMDRDENGVWHVSHWELRQFKSDDVTSRTKKYKENHRPEERKGNVPENVPVNVPGNGTGTPQNTDNRISPLNPPQGKRPRNRRAAKNPEYTPDFERFWSVYPKERRERKPEAFECWLARLAEGVSVEDLITAAANYAMEREGEPKKYTMQPTTFLGPNQRWVKFLEPAEPETPTRNTGRFERQFYPINEFDQ